MSRRYGKRYGTTSWLIGAVVLVALGTAVTWMLMQGDRAPQASTSAGSSIIASAGTPAEPLPKLMKDVQLVERSAGVIVRGSVLLPGGQSAPGATVTLYRLISGWPEWQREHVAQAITRDDGAFQFRCPHLYGYLLRYEHIDYAGDEVEVSILGDAMQLQLKPAFEVGGTVLNDVGAPVPNARVSIESVLGGTRRARHTQTSADGRYSFRNLAAGPAELVARHEFWQPATATALVIGDRQRTDFRFERPSMSPLRGHVISAATQQPIAGATVELVPVRHSLGLVDSISTTTDREGAFLLSGLPRGSMRLWVRHPDYGNSIETQTIGSIAKELSIELPERVKVVGQLLAGDEGAIVGGEILEVQDDGRELAYAVVQPDGNFEFERRLSPGFADFRVLGGAFLFRNMQGSQVGLRLEEQQHGGTSKLYVDVVAATVVRGRFVTADKQPVKDVRMQLMSDSLRLFGAAAWQMDLGKAGDGLMQLLGVERDQWLGISKNDGSFEIRGRRPGNLSVRMSCAGYASRWFRMRVPSSGEVQDVGDFELQPSCSISGRVMRGGQPFVGATVVLTSDVGGSLATTNAFGEYSANDLVPGEYTVKARISGRPTGSNELKVVVAPDAPVRRVDIALEAGRIVRGIVKDESQRALRDALVSVRGRPGEVIATNVAGGFEVELPNREVELVVSFGDRSNQKIVPIALDQQDVAVFLPSRQTSTLVARVAGLPARRPLSGVLLRLTEQADDGAVTSSRWVETPEGELRKASVPSGNVLVKIWCEGYAPFQRVLELKPDEEHDLGEVLLMSGAKLRGVVRDEDGSPIRDAMVVLGEETDLDLFVPTVRSDAEGMFTIQGVTSRSSHLVVRRSGFAASTVNLQLPRDLLSVEPLVVKLERGTTIEVIVPRELVPDDGLVYLRRDGHLLGSTVLDERGKAWFANRSVGQYTVSLFGSDLAERTVQVKPGEEISEVLFEAGSK